MGYVYFVQGIDSDLIKIGRATDLWTRLSGLRSSSPEWLTLLGFIETDEPGRVEAVAHKHFAGFRHRGEWFRAEPELLMYIAAASDFLWEDGWEYTTQWHVVTSLRDMYRQDVAKAAGYSLDPIAGERFLVALDGAEIEEAGHERDGWDAAYKDGVERGLINRPLEPVPFEPEPLS